MMEKFRKYFQGSNTYNGNKHQDAYQRLKPYIIRRTIEIKKSITLRGRPVEMDYNKFFDVLFFVVDEGTRYRTSEIFGIPKSTFTRHVKFLSDQNILEIIFDELIDEVDLPTNIIMTDTFAVPSKDGSEGLGYCYKYKGKKCCKVSLITDINGIVRYASLEPGNVHDSKILKQTIENIHPPLMPIKCLADSGYVGNDLYNRCLDNNIELVSQPRQKRNGLPTHILTSENDQLLKKYRSTIEHVNSKIRRFRGLNVKHVKKISTFRTFLFVALISITCYSLFIKN